MCVEENEKTVCSRIRSLRESRHLSQMDLAVNAGISQSILTYIEQGKRSPSLRTLLKICKALDISPALLFSDSNDHSQNKKEEIIKLIEEL